jgi:hypothetical protein
MVHVRTIVIALAAVLATAGCDRSGAEAEPEPEPEQPATLSLEVEEPRARELEDAGLVVLRGSDELPIVDCEGAAYFSWWARAGAGEEDEWEYLGPEQDARTTCAAGFKRLDAAVPFEDRLSGSCPAEWPGPWTACPDAAWIAAVIGRANYSVTGETGTAATAEGDGWGFNLWATPIPEDIALEDWPVFGRTAGVEIYGDAEPRLWWSAQQRIVWLSAGVTEDARVPTLAELAPLVRASRQLTAPAAR